MQIESANDLASRKCVPCEGGVDACSLDHSRQQMASIPQWRLREDSHWIHRTIRFANFVEMVRCVNAIAELAEAEGHHPDLHLTGYRILGIELTTHAIGGLSENDFVLAAKIDRLIVADFPNAKAQ